MNSTDSTTASKKPNVSRRQIREATVQLMHSVQSHTEQEPGDPWPLILAQQKAKIIRARARAILHLQQNRPGRLKPVFAQRATAPPLLENFLDQKAASRSLRKLLLAESQLPEQFDLLRRQLKSEKEPEVIAESLENIRESNQTSLEHHTILEEALGPIDACPQPLKALAQSLPPLRESGTLLRALLSENLPERPELAALHEAITDCHFLHQETLSLHEFVLRHLTATDELIAKHLENFAPERLAQVDRAVLRLATTELLHNPDIPHAVSINEAIEVARRFGGTESAGFVNGILDKLKETLD